MRHPNYTKFIINLCKYWKVFIIGIAILVLGLDFYHHVVKEYKDYIYYHSNGLKLIENISLFSSFIILKILVIAFLISYFIHVHGYIFKFFLKFISADTLWITVDVLKELRKKTPTNEIETSITEKFDITLKQLKSIFYILFFTIAISIFSYFILIFLIILI